jgi:hypothetical protein
MTKNGAIRKALHRAMIAHYKKIDDRRLIFIASLRASGYHITKIPKRGG